MTPEHRGGASGMTRRACLDLICRRVPRCREMRALRGLIMLGFLTVVCVAGPAADAAGTGWHVQPAARLGAQLSNVHAAAVNRSGTSVVVFSSAHSVSVVQRAGNGSRFKTVGRLSLRWPYVVGITALADGRFLLLYTSQRRLVARELDAGGRFRGAAHVLASRWSGSTASRPRPAPRPRPPRPRRRRPDPG